ncbi:sigma 54-interacting transcriptional regulator [Neobacillus sp. 179-C4.2 HS]|jgi:transcriptional regulator with PAS, ATPase and Fis domain|uniref:Sigma 54-interacting transcriptional regulator n=1 Tax=Neobacillus driksii TaxID=3035913 RepID=A0ABV4YS39_9BACI|nr:sigma 54-interacting transcriptional regulator [Neobacillus sp. 179.-C4.2 HS]MDP5195129.1 sigma 54-interacting transcriptional regulator [Neobacillus sp. 179.-C4.2 HS]
MLKLLVTGSAPLDDYVKREIDRRKGNMKELVVQTLDSAYILKNPTYITDDDVLICGAMLYEEFKKLNVRGNLIPLRVQTNDFYKALVKASKINQEVNIINYQKEYIQIDPENLNRIREELDSIFKIKINQYTFTTADDAGELVKRLYAEGQKVVIGSGLVGRLAKDLGMEGVLWYGKESVGHAVDIAFHVLTAKLAEQSNQKRQNYILENFNEGVINLNVTGRVLSINQQAVELLGLGEYGDLTSQHISDILPRSEILDVLSTNKVVKDMVVPYKKRMLLLNTLPINVNGNFNGIVALFSDAETLQQQENKIRRKLHYKGDTAKYYFNDIIGQSEQTIKAINKARKFARSDSNVLILGESGTGKELFAQSIHNESSRSDQPFIAINCAAIPENLLESEFFGYNDGAFTGAKKGGNPGLFELAHNGTVFLDEIGEIPLSMQAKLLRVLQENVVRRLGSSTAIPINVRVISATNVNLIEDVKNGKFRMDLYYRIAVLNLFLPKLSNRKGDIALLVKAFTAKNYPTFVPLIEDGLDDIIPLLEANEWHGNIREFENTMERLFAYIETPQNVSKREVLNYLRESIEENHLLLDQVNFENSSYQEVIKDIEISKIKEVLDKTNGNRKEAAKILGISRSTLWRKLNEHVDVK